MKRYKSLRGRLTLAILTAVALGLVLLLIIAGTQVSRVTMEAFTHEQEIIALGLANAFTESFETPHAQQVVSSWIAHRELWKDEFPPDTQITIYDLQGSRIASSVDSENALPSGELQRVLSGGIANWKAGGQFHTVVPITHENEAILGIIKIETSLDPVKTRLLSRWMALIGGAGITLILAFLVALWLSDQLTRPLSELHRVARQMAEGQLDARAKVGHAPAEVESLASTFNHMAERVESMLQEQRDFVANASHELRSPLAAIKLRSEALTRQTVTGNLAQKYAQEIDEDVGLLTQLVNDLLELSRLESNEFVLPTQAISITHEIQGCIRSAQPHIAKKHQTLELHLPNNIPDIYIHANDLRVVVGNLLDNAVKYTPLDGKISLSVAWDDSVLKIMVQDTGEGIPAKALPQIHERFFRVDPAHSHNIPGVGLGLAIVAAVLRCYGGKLHIESSGIAGEGTQAYVEFPLVAPS